MKKYLSILKDNIWFLIFFITVLIITFINAIPFLESTYCKTYYAINYYHGFVPRGLPGTLVTLIFGNAHMLPIYIFVYIFAFILTFIICFILNELIKKYKNNIEIILFSILSIFSFTSWTYTFIGMEFGRFDLYTFLFSIISLILIYKNKHLYLIPIISFIAMLCHEVYLIAFSPLICMMLIYNYFKTKDNKALIILVLNITVLFSMFCFIKYAGGNLPFKNAKEMYEVSAKYYDEKEKYQLETAPFLDYYFSNAESKENTYTYMHSITKKIDYVIAIIGFILTIIMYYFFCIKKFFVNKDKQEKILLLFCFLSTFSSTLLFLVLVDYGRWLSFIINGIIMLITYLLFDTKDKKLFTNTKKEIFIFMIIMLFINVLLFSRHDSCFFRFDVIDGLINLLK